MSNTFPGSDLPTIFYSDDLLAPPDLLIVLNSPTPEELSTGQWLCTEQGEFLLDWLDGFEGKVRWALTTLFDGKQSDEKAKAIKDYSPALWDRIHAEKPRAILSLGANVLKALWPSDAGKPQGITKARAMDLMWCGIPLVASMDPKAHITWLASDGVTGQNLKDEYARTFTKLGQMLSGTYQSLDCTYYEIDTPEAAQWLIQRRWELGITQLGFDVEDTTWWPAGNAGLQPHKWPAVIEAHAEKNDLALYPSDLPEKLTMWHRDTLPSWCSICWTRKDGVRETYSIHPDVMTTYEFCVALFNNTTVIAWNILYEIGWLERFVGFDMCDPKWGIKLYDGMIRYGIRDQSITGLGLKEACITHISAPAWDVWLRNQLSMAREVRKAACGVGVAALDDIPDQNGVRLYNACDSFYMVILVEDYLMKDLDGGLHPESNAFAYVTETLPFFAGLEKAGSLVDLDHLNSVLDRKEAILEELQEVIWHQPHAQYAAHSIGVDIEEFSLGKRNDFQALVAACFGQILPQRELTAEENVTLKADQKKKLKQDILRQSLIVPDWAPRTDNSGQLQSGKETLKFYREKAFELGREDIATLWDALLEVKAAQDDIQKFYTILNYTSSRDNRMHTSYRIVKSANESGDKDSEKGTTSGRVSTTPNRQNDKDDPDIRACFIAPPGYSIVACDFSQAEYVVIGATTGDPLFQQWAIEGKDSHLEKAAVMWGYANQQHLELFFQWRSRAECLGKDGPSPEQAPWRKLGKTQNFASLYMEDPATSAAKLKISEEEMIENVLRDRAASPEIYRAQCRLYERFQNGEPSITKIFQRVRYAHTAKNGWRVSGMSAEEFLSVGEVTPGGIIKVRKDHRNLKTFRSIWNAFGAQSDANDITTWQGSRIDLVRRQNPHLQPLFENFNFVHDALYYYVRNDVLEDMSKWIYNTMTDLSLLPNPLGLPLRASMEIGQNLNELH